MKLQPGAVNEVVTRKPALDLAIRTRSSRNNIKDIWDAVGPRGFRIYTQRIWGLMMYACNVCVVEKSQAGWAKLQQILDMSQAKFHVEHLNSHRFDNEGEDEEDEDEEDEDEEGEDEDGEN